MQDRLFIGIAYGATWLSFGWGAYALDRRRRAKEAERRKYMAELDETMAVIGIERAIRLGEKG